MNAYFVVEKPIREDKEIQIQLNFNIFVLVKKGNMCCDETLIIYAIE